MSKATRYLMQHFVLNIAQHISIEAAYKFALVLPLDKSSRESRIENMSRRFDFSVARLNIQDANKYLYKSDCLIKVQNW